MTNVHGRTRQQPDSTAGDSIRRAQRLFARLVPGGWTTTAEDGIVSSVVPVPLATLSGVFVPDDEIGAERIRQATAPFSERGAPWSIGVAGTVPPAVAEVAAELGLERRDEATFTIALDGRRFATAEPAEYRLVRTEAERRQWAATCATAFGMPEAIADVMLAPAIMADPSVRAHLVLRGGEPVATACTILDDGWLGLYSVGTVPAARRSGIGERLVRFVLDEGTARGAVAACLQSSPQARTLYERVGFVDGHDDTVYLHTSGASADRTAAID